MPYTTIDGVNNLLPQDNRVDTETYPTMATVQSWLPSLDSALNVAFVTGGGTLPVTDPDTIIWFGLLEAKEAAYLRMQVGGAAKDNPSLWQGYNDDWLAALVKISDKTKSVAAATSTSGSPSSVTDIVPRLTKDKVY
jgi:hypothetical protein